MENERQLNQTTDEIFLVVCGVTVFLAANLTMCGSLFARRDWPRKITFKSV